MNDLSAFRDAARAMRSRSGFEGSFVRFNGETGRWTTGSRDNPTIIDGRQLLADVRNLLLGWQKFGSDSKPVHAGIGAVVARHEPPQRATLGDLDESRWRNKQQDPWQLTWWLALFDPESRERLIFSTSSSGGRDCLAVLQEAYADHNETREEVAEDWPLVELDGDSYVKQPLGKTIHTPILDIIGWEVPTADFKMKALKPPASAQATPAPLKLVSEPPRERASTRDMDDEIPF